jgi:hypothetical protein
VKILNSLIKVRANKTNVDDLPVNHPHWFLYNLKNLKGF